MTRSAEPWVHTEQSLLGAVINDQPAYWLVCEMVSDTDFGVAAHAAIWRRISELCRQDGKYDFITLCEDLRTHSSVIIAAANESPGSASVKAYAERVALNAEHRRYVAAGRQIATLGPGMADEAKRLLDASAVQRGGSSAQIGEVLLEWYQDLETRLSSGAPLPGIPTGLRDLDAMIGGLQIGKLIILAGRPSMGKSAVGCQIPYFTADSGEPSAIFTMEMGRKEVVERLVSAATSVGLDALRSPMTIEDIGWGRITAAMTRIPKIPLHFDETPGLTSNQLLSRIRQLKVQHGIRVVTIDYLGLLSVNQKAERRDLALGEITRDLKNIAKLLGITIILLAQLSRKCEERADKRPILSDLRESGNLEQDADTVIFVYRDAYYFKDSPAQGIAELIVAKQRNGQTGTVYVKSELQFCRFGDTDWRPQDPSSQPQTVRRFAKPGGFQKRHDSGAL